MATVEVILKEKIDKLGSEADVVSVRRGFARNFLVPQGKAYPATKGNLRHMNQLKEVRAAREAQEIEDAQKLATRIKKYTFKFTLATGQGGKAFGSVTVRDIQEQIKKDAGIDFDRHDIELDKPIKSTGKFDVPVKFHAEISGKAKIVVEAESKDEDGAEDSE